MFKKQFENCARERYSYNDCNTNSRTKLASWHRQVGIKKSKPCCIILTLCELCHAVAVIYLPGGTALTLHLCASQLQSKSKISVYLCCEVLLKREKVNKTKNKTVGVTKFNPCKPLQCCRQILIITEWLGFYKNDCKNLFEM